MVFSQKLYAEWTKVASTSDGYATTYVDLGTLKKSGHKVKMWSIYDLNAPRERGGYVFLSTRSLFEYNCNEETYSLLAESWFSGNMAKGEVIYSPSSYGPIYVPPDSLVQGAWRVACLKMSRPGN